MNHRPYIQVKFLNSEKQLLAVTSAPRKIIVKNKIGSGLHRCWLELYNEDNFLPLQLGDIVQVEIEHLRCFFGRITEKRIDSIDDQLTLYAEYDPENELYGVINHLYENQTVTQILNDILLYNQVDRMGNETSDTILDSLHFVDYPFFAAVDLLAKLAGNWYWDIQDYEQIRFRPPTSNPDHCIHLIEDHFGVNLWQTNNALLSWVEVRNSVPGLDPHQQEIVFGDWAQQSIADAKQVYAHPVTTHETLQHLMQSIAAQLSQPHYEHYIDLIGRGIEIQPGDLIQFSVNGFSLFPYEETFRVKQRDVEYAHETFKVRLHVTTGYESSANYFDHLKHNHTLEPNARLYRFGPFQLDVSQLDSPTHLDPL